MAALSGFFTCFSQVNCAMIGVCSVKETPSISSKLLITTSRSVLLMQDSDTKPTQIWTSKPSQPLTCSAVCDSTGQHYTASINHKLIIWDNTVQDITKIKPTPVSGNINQLYRHPNSGSIIVLYQNGAVAVSAFEQLKDTVQKTYGGFLKSEEVIVNSHIWCSKNGTFVTCLVERSKQRSLCIIPVPEVNQSGKGREIYRIPLETPRCALHETSFCSSAGQLYMHSVWSDGGLYECSLPLTDISHCKNLSCEKVTQLPVRKQQTKQVKITSIKPSLIGVIGLDGEHSGHLCLWDTKFSTMVAKHPLKNSTDNTDVTVSKILSDSNRVWLSTNHGITGVNVGTAPSTLSMAFGKQMRSDEASKLPLTCQQWRIDGKGDNDNAMDVDDDTTNEAHEIFQNICNAQKTKTAKQFKTSVQKLLDSGMPVGSVDMTTILGSILRHVSDRRREDKKFWPKEGLTKILLTGLVAASSCPDFVPCVVDQGDVDILVKCLQNMQDIPDSAVASIIDFTLREIHSDVEEMDEVSDHAHLLSRCPVSQESAQLINLVLECPMNDVFMLECIAKVKFQCIMVLLRYLYYRLNTISVDDPLSLPTNVVINWIILILDAHYSQLVLSAESRTLLLSLHQMVEALANYHDDAEAVYEMLKHISYKETNTQAVADTDSVYSIEIISL